MGTRRASLFAPGKAGITVAVLVKPRAARNRVLGIVMLPGGTALEVAVTAPPAEGRANAAAIAVLAEAWQFPKTALTMVSGNKSRLKTILIPGEPSELLPRLTAWLRPLPIRGGGTV